MDEVVRCVADARIDEERNKNVTTLLSMSLKHGVEIQAELVKERVQDQSCAQSFRRFFRPLSRDGLVAGGYTPCLKDYEEDGHLF